MLLDEIQTTNEMVINAFNGMNNSLDMHIHEMPLVMSLNILHGMIHGIIRGVYNIHDDILYDIYDDIYPDIYYGDNIHNAMDTINDYCVLQYDTTIFDSDDDIYNNVYINEYKICKNDCNEIICKIGIKII